MMCSSENCESMTVNYDITNIVPHLNYIFIVDIRNNYNNSKAKNESYFSEYNVVDPYDVSSVSP